MSRPQPLPMRQAAMALGTYKLDGCWRRYEGMKMSSKKPMVTATTPRDRIGASRDQRRSSRQTPSN